MELVNVIIGLFLMGFTLILSIYVFQFILGLILLIISGVVVGIGEGVKWIKGVFNKKEVV